MEDKDLLQKEAKSLIEDLQNTKKSEKETQNKLHLLKQELQEIRVLAYSTQAIAKTYINKFHPITNNISNTNNYCLLTKQFSENIKDYFDYINSNLNNNNNNNYNSFDKEKNFVQILKFLEDYTRAVSSEMEIAYDKLKSLSDENKDFLAKIKSLELSLHNMSLTNEEKNNTERKQNQIIFELKEENKNLSEDVLALEQQCEKLVSDYKQVRTELKKKLEEIGDLKHENRESNNANLKLNGILKEKENNISLLNFQVAALEDRIVIISKEKKCLEGLIDKVSKSHPVKEIQKIVNEMLTVYDNLSQLERDKAKLEQSLKNIEMQELNSTNNLHNQIDSKHSGNNNELVSMQVKIEKESLKNAVEDLNIKISKILILRNYFYMQFLSFSIIRVMAKKIFENTNCKLNIIINN